jgi:hypothetical protein
VPSKPFRFFLTDRGNPQPYLIKCIMSSRSFYEKKSENQTIATTLLAAMALSSVPAPAQAGILGDAVNGLGELGKGVAQLTNTITANVPIAGGLYRATGAYDAVNKALGAKGYLSMPSDWTTFTVDARTAAISRVLQGNAFLRNTGRLDIKENQTIPKTSLKYGVSPDGIFAIEGDGQGPGFFYDSQTGLAYIAPTVFFCVP